MEKGTSGKIVLQIEYDPMTRQIQVDGPFGDGIMYLGMLEMARIIFIQHTQPKPGQIEIPRVALQ